MTDTAGILGISTDLAKVVVQPLLGKHIDLILRYANYRL